MKVVYKTYQLLNGEEKKLLNTIGDGRIIRLFDKTPHPESKTDVVCPHFLQAAMIYGCPYHCAWCYLQGTYRYIQKENGRIPIRFKAQKDIDNAIETFLTLDMHGMVLNTSELADGLCAETNFYGGAFSEYVMKKFNGTTHKVLFLTKGTYVKHFLEHEWQRNAILSWSLNADPVAQKWEKLAPTVHERIKAAEQIASKGYEVRLRIDPMIAIEGYAQHYKNLVDEIFSNLKPTRITLGCLRGLASTIARAKDKSWLPYLSEKSNWGRKPPIEIRAALYSNVITHLKDKHGFRDVAVCKDTLEIWSWLKDKFGLDYREMKCNCTNSLPGQP